MLPGPQILVWHLHTIHLSEWASHWSGFCPLIGRLTQTNIAKIVATKKYLIRSGSGDYDGVTCLSLVESDHMTWILASDWSDEQWLCHLDSSTGTMPLRKTYKVFFCNDDLDWSYIRLYFINFGYGNRVLIFSFLPILISTRFLCA